jgi:hypothetical protein
MITSYQENLLTLNRLIQEQYISKKILKIKGEEEKKDNLNYHSSLSYLLMKLYYNSIEQSVYNGDRYYYSYVVDGKKLVYEGDRKTYFYEYTNVSYQCRRLLLDTIRCDFLDEPLYNNLNFNEDDIVEDRNHKDNIFGELSKKIMKRMITS